MVCRSDSTSFYKAQVYPLAGVLVQGDGSLKCKSATNGGVEVRIMMSAY